MSLIQKFKTIRSRDEFAPPRPLPSADSFLNTPPHSDMPPPPTSSSPPASASPRRSMRNNGFDMSMTNPMAFLGLRRDSNVKERDVTIAHRKLARKYHPDKNDFSLSGLNEIQATAFSDLK